jgi:hypothetical protein
MPKQKPKALPLRGKNRLLQEVYSLPISKSFTAGSFQFMEHEQPL